MSIFRDFFLVAAALYFCLKSGEVACNAWCWNRFRISEKHNRKHLELVLENWKHRRKSRIVAVWKTSEQQPLVLHDFSGRTAYCAEIGDKTVLMDPLGKVPPVWTGPDGVVVYGGYTTDELREIAERAAEFLP